MSTRYRDERRAGSTTAAVALALVPAAANGFGRFGYGLVLPVMQHELGWSTLTAGSLGAANAAGYLAGAIVADRVLTAAGERAAVLGSLVVSTLAVLGCAATGDVPALLALRLVAGATAAVAFIAGAVVLTSLTADAAPRTAGRLFGLYFAGPGLGIAISAPLVTPIAAGGHWRACWLVLGGLCACCVLVAVPALRRRGRGPRARRTVRRRPWQARRVAALLACYGLFGAGYITFMTFSVAYLRTEGRTPAEVTAFWLLLGASGVVVALLFVAPLSRIRGGGGVALLVAVTALAAALPVLSAAQPIGLVSAVLFSCFFSVTAVVTGCARHHLPPGQWPPAIAGLTAAFGLGQCAGPLLGGALSEGPSGLRAGLLAGAALLSLSALCALRQTSRPAGR